MKAGSLHRPPSWIGLPSRPSRLRLEAEEREVIVLVSELEAAAEEELKLKDSQRFFSPCRWINSPFTNLRVSAEGAVAVAAAALEAEDRCAPRGAVVGGEVDSGRVHCHSHIGLVCKSGGDAVICFCIPTRTKGTAYSSVGGGVLCWWCRPLLVAEAGAKREVGANDEEV